MTRERLENQSLESLHEIARREGVEIPEEADQPELIDLILEAYEEDREERESLNNYPISMEETKFILSREEETLPPGDEFILSARYNESRIVLLLRDPSWAFAYWDIKDTDLKKHKLESSSSGLYLRMFELESDVFDPKHASEYFDIPVQVSDSQWYINLPKQGIWYALQLIYMKSSECDVIAGSNVISVPRGSVSEDWGKGDLINSHDLLIALSGIENLGLASYDNKIPQRIISMLDAQYL